MSAYRKYRIEFDRVGRDHAVPALIAEVENGDQLAHHIHVYVGRFLASRDYMVSVNGECGSISAGRFGTFTVEELA